MVEWKKIGEVCKTITPPKKLVTKEYQERGLYPVIDQGQSEIVGFTDDECALLPDGEYVLFGDHTRFVKYHKGRFAQGADGLKILMHKESITPRYFYYAFANTEVPTRGYSRHWSIAKELEIPVPSIAEQTRIVGILDTFTAAIDNLKQQIAQRRKQYEHYRDQLLDMEGKEGVEMKTLGDLCEIKTGKLNANAQVADGLYPFFTCDAKPFRINTFAFDTEAILISGNGSQVGHLNYYKGKFNAYQRTYVLCEFRDISVAFLFHYLKLVVRPYVMGKSKKGSVPYITLPMLQDLAIPVPFVAEQQRIVSILDTFEQSIANLEQQLAQREKQYEFYRNQLLTFE